MVAERRELSSLPRPPDGYFWSPDAGERRRANLDVYNSRARGGNVPWQESGDGPRADALETVGLPELTPGVSALPARCRHCGSSMLAVEPPLGEHQRGLITCSGCSRQLAWLRSPIRTASRTTPAPVTREPTRVAPSAPPRRLHPVLAFEEVDGCGPACGFRTGHDPATHEEYGRKTAFAEMLDRPTGIVQTGSLTIDFDTDRVTVGDRVAALTPTELRILGALAARLGTLCSQRELLERVWGAAAVDIDRALGHGPFHIARVHLARLRGKLGEAAGLVETVPGRGLILRAERPVGEAHGYRAAPRPRVRRFRLHDRLAAGSGRAVRLVVGRPGPRRVRGRAVALPPGGSQAAGEGDA